MNKRFSDALLGIAVVAVVGLLVLPIPSRLLDFLLVLNLGCSLIVLFSALYVQKSNSLYSFPVVLLLLTLYRLSLNVASARLILSQGEAGKVIETFGRVLISGEVVVGLVVFSIVTIVNFIVIARGASRVSEVAARFALDSLPGKQISIDSAARSSQISPLVAEAKHQELQQESQMYGAMDGAMRFVQGDAVAGVIIIFVNIIGGLYLGISRGEAFADAIQTYTILTVGDGLVSQIPALLTSLCAGIVVSRVSSSEGNSLSHEIGTQLFGNRNVLVGIGVLFFVLGIISGLPTLPFITVGVALIGLGWWPKKLPKNEDATRNNEAESEQNEGWASNEASSARLIIAVDSQVLWRLYSVDRGRYENAWITLSRGVSSAGGAQIPKPSIVRDSRLRPAHYSILFDGCEAAHGVIPVDALMVRMSPLLANSFGLTIIEDVRFPLDDTACFWVDQSPYSKNLIKALGVEAYDALEFILRRAVSEILHQGDSVFSALQIHQQLISIQKSQPGVLEELFHGELPRLSMVLRLFCGLFESGLRHWNLSEVLEYAAVYCAKTVHSFNELEEVQLKEAVSFIRKQTLRRELADLLTARKSLKVITLDERLARLLKTDGTALLHQAINIQGLRESLNSVLSGIREKGIGRVAILVEPVIRQEVCAVIELTENRYLPVLSYEELLPELSVEIVAAWTLPRAFEEKETEVAAYAGL